MKYAFSWYFFAECSAVDGSEVLTASNVVGYKFNYFVGDAGVDYLDEEGMGIYCVKSF